MSSHLFLLGENCPTFKCSFDHLSKIDLYHSEKPYYFSGPLSVSEESSRTNIHYTTHDHIEIQDLRGQEDQLNLDQDGFVLLKHPPLNSLRSGLYRPTDEQVYAHLEQVRAFIKSHLAAEEVLCYNYRYRKTTREQSKETMQVSRDGGSFENPQQPVVVPHTDLTETSGPARLRRHLTPSEYKKYSDGETYRVRILNCWRSLLHTADAQPLAMCDYASIHKPDLIRADRASREYAGEIYYLQYDPSQKWYWISGQSPEEMLVFVNYDSEAVEHGGEGGSVPYMVHSSFLNTRAGEDVKPRESLEVSLIVVTQK
ncbi:hypothetical protein BJY04DRAFT_224563 [Aspergillus karnatakaensis]|uniref:uncharacterized protein n=1 Tax=Aspergillus karnatakaensis TaxID=1810916 RepID=UPI003CCD4314